MSDVELAQLMEDDEIEIIEQASYPDEEDAKQREQAIAQLMQKLQSLPQLPEYQPHPPQIQAQVDAIHQQLVQIQAQPPKLVYDVACKRVRTEGKVCIDNVQPEEFFIARNAKDIETAKFVAHRVQRTKSELKSMGYKNVDDLGSEDSGQAMNSERIQRVSWNDENAYIDNDASNDESQNNVWVLEAYMRCDYDGDGIAELRKVTMAGNTLLDNEPVDSIPFVSTTPVPLPHQFFGLSIADLAMESQRTKTSILRSQLDNMYLAVNGRYFAVEGQVNLDDLLTSCPGGVVRVKQIGAAGRLDQGAPDIGNGDAGLGVELGLPAVKLQLHGQLLGLLLILQRIELGLHLHLGRLKLELAVALGVIELSAVLQLHLLELHARLDLGLLDLHLHLHLHLHLRLSLLLLRVRFVLWRLLGWISEELVGVLEAQLLGELGRGVVEVVRRGDTDFHALRLNAAEHLQVIDLLVLVAHANADVDGHVELARPLARIDRHPAACQLHHLLFLLVLADELQDLLEQIDVAFGEVAGDQVKTHVGAVGQHVHAGRGVVQRALVIALAVTRPAGLVLQVLLHVLHHLHGVAQISQQTTLSAAQLKASQDFEQPGATNGDA